MTVDEAVAAGRVALAAGRWADAEVAFEAALVDGEPPEALDGLAEVRYWQGDYAAAIDLRERAYAGFRARGETRYPAVIAAYLLAFDYVAFYENLAAASGWLARGRAEQWLQVVNGSGEPASPAWVSAICRMYYGGILTAAGRWAEADEELRTSMRTYDRTYRALRSGAVVRLADLRVRQGAWRRPSSCSRATSTTHMPYGPLHSCISPAARRISPQPCSAATSIRRTTALWRLPTSRCSPRQSSPQAILARRAQSPLDSPQSPPGRRRRSSSRSPSSLPEW